MQYNVIEGSVKEAWYNLTEPQSQIRAYVEDVIRGAVRQRVGPWGGGGIEGLKCFTFQKI